MDIDLGHLRKPCACGKDHEIGVELIKIEAGAVEMLMDILENYQNPVFICDNNTRAAAEPFLEEEFKDYPIIELSTEDLKSNDHCVKKMMKQLDYCDRGLSSVSVDVLVAIGAGTIHDLTRYAATEYGIPFVSIPTAASVDGFSSHMISLNWGGIRKTLPGVAPKWILADTNIFAKAPKRLAAAGIGDLFAKYIAILDWRISHLLTDEYICNQVIDLMEDQLRDVERNLEDIATGDEDAMEILMRALIYCGITMEMVNDARPVSGAEHMAAHLWEMDVLDDPLEDMLHGESVAVGLILMTEYYKKIGHAIRHHELEILGEGEKGLEYGLLEQVFSEKGLLQDILDINEPNPLEDIDLSKLEELLPEIEDLIRDLPDVSEMLYKLETVGCPSHVSKLGLEDEIMDITLRVCPYVRRRLSLLRLSKLMRITED